jgi:hypothetical protein
MGLTKKARRSSPDFAGQITCSLGRSEPFDGVAQHGARHGGMMLPEKTL